MWKRGLILVPRNYPKLQRCRYATKEHGTGITSTTENPYEAPPQRISKNISFRSSLGNAEDGRHRPVVLLYGWLVAKARHISKHGDFYLGKGCDVVHVKVSAEELIRPKKAQSVVEQVLEFVQSDSHNKKPILCHGFSVGCYLIGETMVKIHEDPKQRFSDVGQRMCGHILDSPVDFDNVPYGVGQALSQKAPVQKAIQSFVEGYLKVFYKTNTIHHIRSSATMKENKLKIPTLFLYSDYDKVATAKAIEDVVEVWKQKDLVAYTQMFEGSSHVSHYHMHPVQYISAVNSFLENMSIVNKCEIGGEFQNGKSTGYYEN